MPRWTPESRKKHAELMRAKIKDWKPWQYSSGPTSSFGKSVSSRNAYKHGWYSRESKENLKAIRAFVSNNSEAHSADYHFHIHQMLERFIDDTYLNRPVKASREGKP